jgi:hypothetical protein
MLLSYSKKFKVKCHFVESCWMSVGYYLTISLPKHCKFNWFGNKTISHLLNLSPYNVLWPCLILLSHHHGCKNRSKSVSANESSIVCDPSLHGKVCCIIIILGKRMKWWSLCSISPSQKKQERILITSVLPFTTLSLSLSLSLSTHPKPSTLEDQSRIKNFIPGRWYGMSTTSHIDWVSTHAKTLEQHLMVTESTNFPVFSNDHKEQVSNAYLTYLTYLISNCQEERTIRHAWVSGFF